MKKKQGKHKNMAKSHKGNRYMTVLAETELELLDWDENLEPEIDMETDTEIGMETDTDSAEEIEAAVEYLDDEEDDYWDDTDARGNGEELEYLEQEIFGYYDDDVDGEDDYWEADLAGRIEAGGMAAAKPAAEGRRAKGRKPAGRKAQNERHGRGKKRKGPWNKLAAGAGALVMVFAITAGSFYVNARTLERQVASFEEVGSQMEGIGIIGEGGLVAMADAQSAKAVLEEIEREEAENAAAEQYEEKEWKAEETVTVEMHLSSMQKDLKIKFVNAKTGKLVPNVAFEVEVTGADKKSYVLKDEDMDGIIYATDVAPGKCTVAMKEVTGVEGYAVSTEGVPITVKDKIEYKKVDVTDEVKKESEVNAAIEDTGKKGAAVESTLTDTVGWTESTKTAVGGEAAGGEAVEGEFVEVPKEKITDPMTLVSAGTFVRFAAAMAGDALTDAQGTEGQAGTGDAAADGTTAGAAPDGNGQTGENGQTDTKQVPDGNGAVNAGTPVETGNQPGAEGGAGNSSVGQEIGVSLSQTELSMKSGESTVLTTTTNPEGNAVTWESSNPAIAAVSSGTVTAVGAGTAEIAAVSATGNKAVCKVTVDGAEEGKPAVVLSSSTEKILAGKTVTLSASVNGIVDTTVTWKSDNESVASVSPGGEVTGIAPGAAVITAVSNGDNSVSAACEVIVKANPEKDTVSKLLDNDGNQLYVMDGNGKYREAVYADYYTADKFFKKADGTAGTENTGNAADTGNAGNTAGGTEYKYTGWQTIDGKTYYFDAEGNKVTGEQIIQGAKYSFDSEGVLSTASGSMGIDVSKWNGNIDWNAVKNSGVSYVIIRCGYRGSTTGALIEDPKFRSNIQGATAAGLKVGVYFFTQAVNEVEAVEEASMVASLIGGYKISYPVFLDVEPSGGRADSISRETRTEICRAFCQTMQNSGYTAGIYASKTWLATHINAGSLTSYKIWMAQYAAAPTYSATKYDLWQYSAGGSVAGISGPVDMNISYLGY